MNGFVTAFAGARAGAVPRHRDVRLRVSRAPLRQIGYRIPREGQPHPREEELVKKAAVTCLLTLFALAAVAQELKPTVEATGTLERVLDDRGAVDLYVKLAPARRSSIAAASCSRSEIPSDSCSVHSETSISTLIVLAGMFIVFKDWVGTPSDLLAALFWGFAADISVATILTFAKPLKTKKLFS